MSDRLILYSGAGIADSGNPTTEDNQGIIFVADGADHICVWCIPVPVSLRALNTLNLRFSVIDGALGVGNVKFVVSFFSAGDDTGILTSSSDDLIIPMNNVPSVISADIDIGTKIPSNGTILFVQIARNSSDPQDTYANDVVFIGARTLDV